MPPKASSKACVKKTKTKIAQNNKTFQVDEKILVLKDNLLTEATCIEKKKTTNNQFKYLVKYRRWKTIDNEWIDANDVSKRLHKLNAKSLKRQHELRQKARGIKNKIITKCTKDSHKREKKVKISTKINNSESTSFNNSVIVPPKITPPNIMSQDDFLNAAHEVKVRMPEDLKPILVDDWDLIVNQNQLLHLPTKSNIDKILNDYLINKKTQASKLPSNHTIPGYEDFVLNAKKYFNYLLKKHLLYPTELEQFLYLKDNYDSLTQELNQGENSGLNKESRRIWRKNKKSKKHPVNKQLSVASETSSTSNSTPKTPTSVDNNSQSETSDSNENTNINKDSLLTEPSVVKEPDQSTDVKKLDYTKLYGVIHLLRLFAKMGHLLFYTDLNEERIALLNSYIYDFLKYLNKNLYDIGNFSDSLYIDSISFTSNLQK